MIDRITLLGAWGPYQPAHLKHLPTISIPNNLQPKVRPVTKYIDSPLTGKQTTLNYLVDKSGIGMVRLDIPLASALVGHNWLHAGLGAIKHEVACLRLLVPVFLHSIGFTPQETQRYLDAAVVEDLEVTWHTLCSSATARDKALERSYSHLRLLGGLSTLHDLPVARFEGRDSSTGKAILVKLKSGVNLRQYGKDQQIHARGKSERLGKHVSKKQADKLRTILNNELPLAVRNELVFNRKILQAGGISSLEKLTKGRLEHLIDTTWARFIPKPADPDFKAKKLSPAAKSVYAKHQAGQALDLKDQKVLRARRQILGKGGPDVAIKTGALRFEAAAHWARHAYQKRRKADGSMWLVVSRVSAPALLAELQAGLTYLQDGELPDLADQHLDAWLGRWKPLAVLSTGVVSAPKEQDI